MRIGRRGNGEIGRGKESLQGKPTQPAFILYSDKVNFQLVEKCEVGGPRIFVRDSFQITVRRNTKRSKAKTFCHGFGKIRNVSGRKYDLKPEQKEAIEHLLKGRDVLAVLYFRCLDSQLQPWFSSPAVESKISSMFKCIKSRSLENPCTVLFPICSWVWSSSFEKCCEFEYDKEMSSHVKTLCKVQLDLSFLHVRLKKTKSLVS